ncbi:ABC transporter permease subunit [Brachybacterium sp. GPGPB12]|uniref:ABC transporter permease n=1 Tax=Brachybacterium sp. GPGPB12 TaxID=3023517 RepID=UPI0031345EA9
MTHALKSLSRSTLGVAISLAVVLAIWAGGLRILDVSSFIGKGPLDVFGYLALDEDAAAHRAAVADNLTITLADAAIGFVAGLALALVVAAAFTLIRGVEDALALPLAMLAALRAAGRHGPDPHPHLRPRHRHRRRDGRDRGAVPGTGHHRARARSASPAMVDVVSVFGGSKVAAFRKVALPASLPAFFTAPRISIPGALTGAPLAEWLATGQGIGYQIVSDVSRARYESVWASVVVVTAASLLLYGIVSVLERLVAAPHGPDGLSPWTSRPSRRCSPPPTPTTSGPGTPGSAAARSCSRTAATACAACSICARPAGSRGSCGRAVSRSPRPAPSPSSTPSPAARRPTACSAPARPGRRGQAGSRASRSGPRPRSSARAATRSSPPSRSGTPPPSAAMSPPPSPPGP